MKNEYVSNKRKKMLDNKRELKEKYIGFSTNTANVDVTRCAQMWDRDKLYWH